MASVDRYLSHHLALTNLILKKMMEPNTKHIKAGRNQPGSVLDREESMIRKEKTAEISSCSVSSMALKILYTRSLFSEVT